MKGTGNQEGGKEKGRQETEGRGREILRSNEEAVQKKGEREACSVSYDSSVDQ